MSLNTLQEIEPAIGALTPQGFEEFHLWLDQPCRSLSTRSLERIFRRGASRTASIAPPLSLSPKSARGQWSRAVERGVGLRLRVRTASGCQWLHFSRAHGSA